MCYELEWFHWKRASEIQRKRAQMKSEIERTPVKAPIEPVKPSTTTEPAPKVQEELEPV